MLQVAVQSDAHEPKKKDSGSQFLGELIAISFDCEAQQ
jgi:hypothetical protein